MFEERDNWLFFPNSILANMETLDCNDTVDGICYENITQKECVQICKDDSNCDAGYFISNKDFSICVPLQTSLHPDLNPVSLLRNKNETKELQGFNTVTFLNKGKYSFPPDMANAVLYEDLFSLKNVKSGKEIQIPNDNMDKVSLQKEQGVNLQLLPLRDTTERIQSFIPVRYNSPVVINIPGTNLILSRSHGSNLKWLSRVITVPQVENTFKIHSATSTKNPLLYYGDKVYITYQNIYLLVYNDIMDQLELVHTTYKQKGDLNADFELVPNMEAFYGGKGKNCEKIALSQAKKNGIRASYKNSIVSRNPTCWGLCGKNKKTVSDSEINKTSLWVIIIIGIFLLFFLFSLFFFLRNKLF